MANMLDEKTLNWINRIIEDVEFLESFGTHEIEFQTARPFTLQPLISIRKALNVRMVRTGRIYCGEVFGLNNPLKLNISTTTLMKIKKN